MERVKFYNGEIVFPWTEERGKVEVLDWNNGGERVIVDSARICRGNIPKYSSHSSDLSAKDSYLIKFLLKAKHLRPFDFANITFVIEAPIFVERQLRVYRTATILERSLRACSPIESGAVAEYEKLIASGEPKELARRVLPLGTFTTFAYQMSVRNLLHLFEERLTKETQLETRFFVQSIWEEFFKRFTLTASAFECLNPDLLYKE